jgi:hypothetical protein
MRITKNSFRHYLDRELIVGGMVRALRHADLECHTSRRRSYSIAGFSPEHAEEFDSEAVRVAGLYKSSVARRAAAPLLSCVGAAALLIPTAAVAGPLLTDEGAVAILGVLSVLWAVAKYAAVFMLGVLLACCLRTTSDD